jgi:hypothetical protein
MCTVTPQDNVEDATVGLARNYEDFPRILGVSVTQQAHGSSELKIS